MSKRFLSALHFGKKFLLSNLTQSENPKYVTVKISKKVKVKTEKSNLSLGPKSIGYVNYINKRNLPDAEVAKCLTVRVIKNANGSLTMQPQQKICYINRRNYSSNFNRHNYDKKVEKLVNDQINMEFTAAYTYLNIAAYYGRSDVALPGLYAYFMKMFYEELEHGFGFLKYQNLRGGIVCLLPILPIEDVEWPDFTKTFSSSLTMEKSVKEQLQKIKEVADGLYDTDLSDFLDGYIKEQERSIFEMSRLYARAMMLSKSDLGKYLFDREIHETHRKENPTELDVEKGEKSYT